LEHVESRLIGVEDDRRGDRVFLDLAGEILLGLRGEKEFDKGRGFLLLVRRSSDADGGDGEKVADVAIREMRDPDRKLRVTREEARQVVVVHEAEIGLA